MNGRPKGVVVAEDEIFIRILASDTLTEAGFEVFQAHNAEKAKMLLIENAASVIALFTDIHMPGEMDGLQLAHHATSHWPWIAILISSGLAIPAAHEMPKGSRFLPKPYDPAHAVKHIRELIGDD